MIEQSNKPDMLKQLRMQHIDVDQCGNGYICTWNVLAMKLHSKAKDKVLNDMRNYFRVGNE